MLLEGEGVWCEKQRSMRGAGVAQRGGGRA